MRESAAAKNLSEKISFLLEKDLTQEQFARKVGITYSTVNHWENGKRVPLPFLLKRLIEMKEELDSRDTEPHRGRRRRDE
jgi:transcriptional regulator with XRE-family HTH domain